MKTDRLTCFAVFLILIVTQAFLIPPSACAKQAALIFATPKDPWPPFIIPSEEGPRCCGIMPDIFNEICTAIGHDVVMEFYPEKRCRMLLAQSQIDAYPKSIKWVEDPSAFLWSDPVMEVCDIIVFRQGSPIRYSTPRSLAGKQIGVIHGFSYPTLDPFFENTTIHKQTAFNTKSLLLMLARGRVDGIVTSRPVAEWIIHNEPELQRAHFGFSETAVDSAPYGFAFAKERGLAPFIEKFNRELAAMRRDGRLEEILQRYW